MGWAKYYEDNMSIYIGRMVMKDSVPACRVRHEKRPIKKNSAMKQERAIFSETVIRPEIQSGRRGLEVIFPNGVEDSMIRKLQMNGWWWSKVNACWCNLDTKGNRKYAETLFKLGARLSVVA